MTTRYDILPEAQRRLLPALAPLGRLGFVLYGGTAMALRLGHRASIDFDFFTDRPLDRPAMNAAVPLIANMDTLQDEIDAWTVQTRGGGAASVKVSFFQGLALDVSGCLRPTTKATFFSHRSMISSATS